MGFGSANRHTAWAITGYDIVSRVNLCQFLYDIHRIIEVSFCTSGGEGEGF